jgi:putative NADH-flavin reductase
MAVSAGSAAIVRRAVVELVSSEESAVMSAFSSSLGAPHAARERLIETVRRAKKVRFMVVGSGGVRCGREEQVTDHA